MKMRARGMIPSRGGAWAAVASAALFAIAFPPFKLVIPAFVCLIPIAVFVATLADDCGRAAEAARVGFWFGFLGYGANLYWIAVALRLYTNLALLGYVASLIWLAPVIALTMLALYFARKVSGWPLAILLPIIWTASELTFNYLSDLSFPWLPLGLAVAHVPLLAQVADISGVRGVSFCIAAVNGFLADAWLLRHDRRAMTARITGALIVVAAVGAYGQWRIATIQLRPLARIAIIQPDIPEEAKLTTEDPSAHVGKLVAMTRAELSRSPADLVVWPEAALDRFLWQYPAWLDSLRSAVADHPAPMVVGFMDSSDPSRTPFAYYNAALLTDPRGYVSPQPPYRKHYLVPIVERVPFVNPDWFRGVDYFGGFWRGTTEEPFHLDFGTVGVLICYESIFPQLSREYAEQGTSVLLNITNDAWFQRSTAPYQHFAHLSLRAIENRVPIVRAANTGISGWIDPLGRVRAQTTIFVPRTETYDVEVTTTKTVTLYTRVGDWLGFLCFIATLGFMVASWLSARRRRRFGAA